jgi:hypothetical protein
VFTRKRIDTGPLPFNDRFSSIAACTSGTRGGGIKMDNLKRIALALVLGAVSLGAMPRAQAAPPDEPAGLVKKRAPEIDPAAAGAVVTLLVGGGVLIAARRARRAQHSEH